MANHKKRGRPVRQTEERLTGNCAEQNEKRVFYGEECLEQDIAQAEADLKELQEQDPEGFARLKQEEALNYAEILKKIQERRLEPAAEGDTVQD